MLAYLYFIIVLQLILHSSYIFFASEWDKLMLLISMTFKNSPSSSTSAFFSCTVTEPPNFEITEVRVPLSSLCSQKRANACCAPYAPSCDTILAPSGLPLQKISYSSLKLVIIVIILIYP